MERLDKEEWVREEGKMRGDMCRGVLLPYPRGNLALIDLMRSSTEVGI